MDIVTSFDAPTLTSALVAALVSAIVVEGVRSRAVRLGLMDLPNSRSTHSSPTPRGGGIGILAGLVAGLCVAAVTAPERLGFPVVALLLCSFVVAGIGLMDDRWPLSPYSRLAVHLTAALILTWALGPLNNLPFPAPLDLSLRYQWVGVLLTVLWLAGITNFFNFMDGIDGLAGGQAAASGIGIVIAGWSSDAVVASAALAGASIGFLIHNWPPARVFMGDVGSGAIGFLLAGLPLLAPVEKQPPAVFAVAVGLALFIFDPVWTLGRRITQGEPIFQAHRQHLYQKIVPAGTVYRLATTAFVASALFLCIAGALSFRDSRIGWATVTMAAVFCLTVLLLASRASRARH